MSGADILLAVATGLVAGAFAGAMGVGGGVIMVPVLVELLDTPQRLAQGTSLAVIVVTAIVGTMAARRSGLLQMDIALKVSIGGAVGGVAGSLLALDVIDEKSLKRSFGALVLLTAARMARRTMVAWKSREDTATPASP